MAKEKTLRNQQRSFTRARFIDAGLEVFKRVGFNNATVDMITSEAGANRSTFYLHFKDKTELILAAEEALQENAEATLGPLNRMWDPSFKEFRKWVEHMAQIWEEEHKIYEAIMQAQFSDPNVAKENYKIILEDLAQYMSHFSGKRRQQAKLRVELFFMQLETFFYTTICQSAKKPSKAELDSLAELGYFALFDKTR